MSAGGGEDLLRDRASRLLLQVRKKHTADVPFVYVYWFMRLPEYVLVADRGHDSGVSLVCSSDSDKRRDCAKLFMHFVLDRWGRGDVLT